MSDNKPNVIRSTKSVEEGMVNKLTVAAITISDTKEVESYLDEELFENPELCVLVAENCIVMMTALANHSNDSQLKRFALMMGCEVDV